MAKTTALPTFYDYKGYRLAVDTSHRSAHYGHVCVWSSDNLDLCYCATSLDKAMAWVDAYRDGDDC